MPAIQKTTILASITILAELDPDKPQIPGQPPQIRLRRLEWVKDDTALKGIGAILMQLGKSYYDAASPIQIVPAIGD